MVGENEATPHVAIDARILGQSGIGTYLSNILPRVIEARQDWTFSVLGDPERLVQLALGSDSNVRIVECTAPIYSLREQVAVARRVPRDAGVVWAPHYNVPLLSSKPLVVTIHDLAHLRCQNMRASPNERMAG